MDRYRPGVAKEQIAREVVRQRYPLATSSYTPEGAEVYDPATDQSLGRESAGDWVVELAWQAAARNVIQTSSAN
jgi:hypothetical protein